MNTLIKLLNTFCENPPLMFLTCVLVIFACTLIYASVKTAFFVLGLLMFVLMIGYAINRYGGSKKY
jgi:hypothetical protein